PGLAALLLSLVSEPQGQPWIDVEPRGVSVVLEGNADHGGAASPRFGENTFVEELRQRSRSRIGNPAINHQCPSGIHIVGYICSHAEVARGGLVDVPRVLQRPAEPVGCQLDVEGHALIDDGLSVSVLGRTSWAPDSA